MSGLVRLSVGELIQPPAQAGTASVTVTSSQTTAFFQMTPQPVTSKTAGPVTATPESEQNGTALSKTVNLSPNAISSMYTQTPTVTGPTVVWINVILHCPVGSGGLAVKVSTTNAGVARPVDEAGNPITSILLPEGSGGTALRVQVYDVNAPTVVSIKASANGTTKNVKLTVN